MDEKERYDYVLSRENSYSNSFFAVYPESIEGLSLFHLITVFQPKEFPEGNGFYVQRSTMGGRIEPIAYGGKTIAEAQKTAERCARKHIRETAVKNHYLDRTSSPEGKLVRIAREKTQPLNMAD